MKPWILGGLGIGILLIPVKVTCGSPGAACAQPPIPGSNSQARYYYEYEPLAVMLLESVIQINLPFYYFSGIE
ncbi:hypothetical protein [Calothrix sp. 336/3]|uniref:hypothetical protein n=1 Tax=Calothrix sp. 336/3 TaxID=1337936 RepID=UPI0004E45AAA|nr:hypothetical protein [Calothrix sp. 336/3]AKG21188.1 hypothetical protein IJ00_07640 [Calothrix sp. 336/3]